MNNKVKESINDLIEKLENAVKEKNNIERNFYFFHINGYLSALYDANILDWIDYEIISKKLYNYKIS